jgi:hypothetical protein
LPCERSSLCGGALSKVKSRLVHRNNQPYHPVTWSARCNRTVDARHTE